jgi:hypothetical protein
MLSARPIRTGRNATLIAVAALLLGACTSSDADRGDVVDALVEAGVPESQAEDCGDRFTQGEDRFTQDELNDIASADDPGDVSEALWQRVESILSECISGEGGETTESTESTDGETTETTGEETTTTTAASE